MSGPLREICTDLIRVNHAKPPDGPLPELQWLPITSLVIDDAYQRPLMKSNIEAIGRLAEKFNWQYFSTVPVAPVAGGLYAILDGQHRVHAAAARGIGEVPCQIIQADRQAQAASFAAINGAITNVTVWNLYRAALAAGEPWAVDADCLTREAGCRLMTANMTASDKKPGQIYAIRLVQGFIQSGEGERMKIALRLLRQCDHGDQLENWTHVRLRAWCECFIERNRLFAAHSFDTVLGVVNEIDLDAIDDKVTDIVKHNKRSGLKVLSKYEYFRAELGTLIDKALPVRLAVTRVAS